MRALMLFVTVFGLVVLLMFAWSRSTISKRPAPVVRVTTRDGDIIEMPMERSGRGSDPRLGSFLRTAMVAEEAYFAETGHYAVDAKLLPLERPANTALVIARADGDRLRLSAVNQSRKVQCDMFTGDSARNAFGYAFDPRIPRCGKVRK